MNFKDTVAEYGAHNIRVVMGMKKLEMAGFIPGIAFMSSDSPREMVECRIDESRYKVAENYKVKFVPMNPAYGSETYYQMDLKSIMRDHPEEFVWYYLTADGYQRIEVTE